VRRIWYPAAMLSVVMLTVAAVGTAASAAPVRQAPPPAPTDLAVSGYGSSVMISWQQPRGSTARSFRVYEGAEVVARNTTTFAWLSNLGFGRTRTYTVTAVDARGQESAHSAAISRYVGVSGVPPQCYPVGPVQLAVTDVTRSAATLRWGSGGGPGTVTVTGGPGGPVSSDLSGVRLGGLAPGTTYTLTAVRHSSCNGPNSPPVSVTVVTAPDTVLGRPEAPVGPAVTAQTDTSITLSWQPPAGGTPATRYAVYEGGQRVATTSGTSATVGGLYHATRHAFTVAAIDARGNESAGAAVTGSTATCQARPPRPTAVRAEPLSASSVRLDWVQEAAAVSYTIYDRGTAISTSLGTSVVIGGLPSASTHRLRVVATLVSGCGTTRASAAATVTTLAGPSARPARPEGFRMVSGDQMTGTVTLGWAQPAGGAPVAEYRIYRGVEVLARTSATNLALALPQATTQVLTVAAVTADGLESAHSAPLSVQVPYLPPP